MERGDKAYKVELKVDNYGTMDYSVKSGICLGHKGADVVINLDSDREENITENWQLWDTTRAYALEIFKVKLEVLLKRVETELNTISEQEKTNPDAR